MNAPEMLTTMNCPSDETLALFVEGKLEGDARAAVIEHLTECADCRDIVVMATEEAANNVVPFRRWLPYIAAAAAVLVLMFGVPALWERWQGDDLARINAEFAKRQVRGRLSIDTPAHKPLRDYPRGGEGMTPEQRAELAAANAAQRVSEKPTQENLHKAGIAFLIALQDDEAIDFLEAALKQGESVALLNDTAAAHIERMRPNDLTRALELSDRSLKLERTTTALWNRALALQYLEKDAEATVAFTDFVNAEPDPEWDAEAQEHIEFMRPVKP